MMIVSNKQTTKPRTQTRCFSLFFFYLFPNACRVLSNRYNNFDQCVPTNYTKYNIVFGNECT